jgi:hypothetical protein
MLNHAGSGDIAGAGQHRHAAIRVLNREVDQFVALRRRKMHKFPDCARGENPIHTALDQEIDHLVKRLAMYRPVLA